MKKQSSLDIPIPGSYLRRLIEWQKSSSWTCRSFQNKASPLQEVPGFEKDFFGTLSKKAALRRCCILIQGTWHENSISFFTSSDPVFDDSAWSLYILFLSFDQYIIYSSPISPSFCAKWAIPARHNVADFFPASSQWTPISLLPDLAPGMARESWRI